MVDNDDELEIHFHYCPYVTEWVKQGKNPEQIARLCDVAMAGDHAFAQEFSCLDFTLVIARPRAPLPLRSPQGPRTGQRRPRLYQDQEGCLSVAQSRN